MLERNNLLKNLFLFLYIFGISYLIYIISVPTYGVNDDVILQNWLSGFYTEKPESMIRGSATPKILFGYFLSTLYKIFPLINWFTIFILILTLYSWFLIGQVVIKLNQFFIFIFYLFISTLHLFWFIPSPTYTACAVILAFSILTRIIVLENNSYLYLFLMCLIYVAAYLIRPESFIFGSLALIPVLIKKLIQNKKFQIKFLFFISITLIFITFDYLTEINFYKSSSQWTEYRNLETARYKIQANRIEEALKENPKKYNWTENEVKLFEQYITIDKKVFNESKYNRLINQVNSDLQKNSVKDFIFIGHKNLIDSDINWEWFNLGKLIPISFLLFAFLFWPRGGHFLLLTFVSYLFLYFAMLYISFYLRQPERVQVSAIFIAILIPFAAGASNVDKKIDFNNLTNNIIQFLLIILVISYAIPQIRYLDKKYSGANSIFWIKEQEILSQLPANSIFIGNASQFRNNWSNPYSVRQSEVENRIMTLGWHNYSPHWKTRAQRLGLDPENMWNSIINNKNVYFLSDEETFNFVRKYLEEQRIIYNNVEKVRSFDFVGNDYNIWKFN